MSAMTDATRAADLDAAVERLTNGVVSWISPTWGDIRKEVESALREAMALQREAERERLREELRGMAPEGQGDESVWITDVLALLSPAKEGGR